MDLIVNATAVAASSLGARRYYAAIRQHLDWPGRVIETLPATGRTARIEEMFAHGRRDAILWSPCHRGPLFAHNHVVTVLDCINIEHVYRGDWRLPILRTVFARLLDNAVRIVCISHATRAAVERNFAVDPAKLHVFAGPIDVGSQASATAQPRTPGDFVMMITNPLQHKNTRRAGESFAASSAAKRGIALKVVGRMDPVGLAACARAGIEVTQLSGISDEALQALIRDCRFLWSPSLDEGLNLPIAEALAANIDVLASDIAVHREFYNGEVAFFDPVDTAAMVAALEAAFVREPGWYPNTPDAVRPSSIDVARQYRTMFETLAAEIA